LVTRGDNLETIVLLAEERLSMMWQLAQDASSFTVDLNGVER
jgi:hypothetical protein